MSFPAARQGDPTAHGGAVLNGSGNVFINGSPAAFAGCSTTSCPVHCSGQAVVQGSSTVFINNVPAVFVGSPTSCGAAITAGSPNVFIGDGRLTKTSSQSEPASSTSAGIATGDHAGMAVSGDHAGQARYDDRFVMRNASGQALAHVAYTVQRESGIFEYGETDGDGHTHLLASVASAENIDVYLAG
ncbi:PAAR domain-containing protein [Trinickia mobilis]|uniref:PAAR domain-containing protein n=1 Tax=Trinickia mobilis TaxID=2816356 RepID=UPI001A8D84CD